MNKRKVASLVVATTMVTGNVAMAATNDGKNNNNNDINKSDINFKSAPVINGIQVNKMLIDKNYYKDVTINPKYIVIHDTDNRSYGAGAIANRNYFANHDEANASAHYIVDDKNIVQALEDNWFGWHIGDKYPGVTPKVPEAKNNNSIGIEITVNPDSNFDVAMKNAIELVKYLMIKNNIPAQNVIRHQDATGKTCPKMMIKDKPYLWDVFKKAIGNGDNTSIGSGDYSVVKNEEAVVTSSIKQAVYREMNVAMGTIGQVVPNEKVRVNYIKNSWANITFKNVEGKSLTGFVSADNLNINNLERLNKTAEITGNSRVSVYSDLSGTPFDYVNTRDVVTYNYLYKQWANITFKNSKGETVSGFVNANQVKVNGSIDRGDSNITGKTGKVINASAVNVREDGVFGSTIVGLVYRNEEVSINFTKGEWTNVTFKTIDGTKRTGFMKSEYIYVNNNGSQQENTNSFNKGQIINVTTGLRVRSGAGTNYDVIGWLSSDSVVSITGKQGGWYSIKYNNVIGYISESYVKLLNGENINGGSTTGNGSSIIEGNTSNSSNNTTNNNNNSNTEQAINKLGKVSGAPSGVRIRNGAGTNFDVLGWLNDGNSVQVISKVDNWYKISVNNINGYIHGDYIQIANNTDGNNNTNSNGGNKVDNGSTNNGSALAKRGQVKNVTTGLRIREQAGQSYGIAGWLNPNDTFDILSKEGSWYKIKVNNITGFVHGDYVKEIEGSNGSNNNTNGSSANNNNTSNTPETVILTRGKVVNVDTNLRVRASNSTSSNIVGYLPVNSTFDIIGKVGDWYKIKFDTYSVKKEGYVHGMYVEEFKEVQNNNDMGKKVVEEAKKYLGIGYLWGGTTPTGFDCSGLTSYVYDKFGIKIGRTTWDQINNGKIVPLSALKEGDLIFFGDGANPSNPTHVGMYIGNDQFIHSSSGRHQVTISKLSEFGMNKIQANRYVK